MSIGITRPAERLEVLLANRKTVKRGQVITAKPAADLAGMSWSNLRNLIQAKPEFQSSGAVKIGSEGRAYSIDAGKMLDLLIKLYREEAARLQEEEARSNAMGGIEIAESSGRSRPTDEAIKIVRLQRDVRLEKIAQKELGYVAVFSDGAMDYNATLQDAIFSSAQRADPNGLWPPEYRIIFENAVRDILLAAQRAADKWVNKLGNNATRPPSP